MPKKRTIILGAVAVGAIGVGLTYGWRHWQEKSILDDSRIAPARIKALGYGESRPVADNASDAGRALNRRVELRIK